MLERATFDGSAPAICTACGEPYSDRLEPDAENCECPECGAEAVSSVLIIAGLI